MRADTEHLPASGEPGPTRQRTGAALTNVATLLPTQVPGRLTRKARQYLPQIVQLRAQGYTLEAIQEALAAVGVLVSLSTVRREAIRPLPPAQRPINATASSPAILPAPTSKVDSVSVATSATPVPLEPGKDVAAAYAQSKSTNPLSRAKDRS